jgi:hypothetical protein
VLERTSADFSSLSSGTRAAKSSSDERDGSTGRMVPALASKRHGCMLPPDGADVAQATMKLTVVARRARVRCAAGGRVQRRWPPSATMSRAAEAAGRGQFAERSALATIAPPPRRRRELRHDSLLTRPDAAALR